MPRSQHCILAATAAACLCYLGTALAAHALHRSPGQLTGDNIATVFVIGDYGRMGTNNQTEVAAAMADVASSKKPDFVIASGDNFYPSGLTSVLDDQFERSFAHVYTGPTLEVPFYAVLGNHDYGDGGTPQQECITAGQPDCKQGCCYSPLHQMDLALTQRDWRWNLQRKYTVSLGQWDADIFFIDTTPFVADYRAQPWAQLPGGVASQSYAAQLRELETDLAKSHAGWKIVVGHHPVFSQGDHGDTPELQAYLRPLLNKYGVQAYICGHDHNLQHMEVPGDQTQYILSGAGSQVRGGFRGSNNTRFQYDGSGFVSVVLNTDEMLVDFYGLNKSSPLYSATIPKGSGPEHDIRSLLKPAHMQVQ